MESPSRGQVDSRPHTPNDERRNGSSDSQRDASEPASPISPSSASFAVPHDRDQDRIESIISPGPVRTVKLQRHSVPGAKPRYVITDVESQLKVESTSSDVASKNANHVTRQRSRKLDFLVWCSLITTTAVLLGAFGFLVYLWVARDAKWHSIVVSNWMVRATTLSANIMWIAVCSQELIVCAMLFCLLTSASNKPTSPTRNQYVPLRRRAALKLSRRDLAIGVLFAFVAAALQFSSTILLADFDNGLLASGHNDNTDAAYSLSNKQRANVTRAEPAFNSVDPAQFPLFAEFAQQPTSDRSDVDDTGESIRAFLPLSSSADRTSFATYQGQATLMNSRVICLAPTIENVTYTSSGLSLSPGAPTQQVQGSLSVGNSTPDGLQAESGALTGLEFNCNFELAQAKTEWPITLCSVQQSSGTVNVTSPFANGIMADTSAFILLNHTANATIPVSASISSSGSNGTDIGTGSVTISSWNNTRVGVWTNLTYAPNPIFSIQLSLCFTSMGALDAVIETSGAANRSEPVVQADGGDDVFGLNFDEVLSQLDIPNNGTTGRDTLTLKGQNPWGSSGNPTSALSDRSAFTESGATYGLCTFCGSYTVDSVSRGVAATLSIVFQQALQNSGSPAKALQALFTLTSSTQYYSRLPYFDLESSVVTQDFQQAYHPHRHTGLIAVGALLATHLITVAVITALFLLQSKDTLATRLRRQIAKYVAATPNDMPRKSSDAR